MEEIKPTKIGNITVAFYLFGQGEKIGLYSLRIFTDKEPDQIGEKDCFSNEDGRLILYYDVGKPGISNPHWQGHCFINPNYDSQDFREGMIDYLINQKIIECPALIGFKGWDNSEKVQGNVVRYADNGQDIFISRD